MAEKIVIDLDFDVKGSEVTLGQLEKRAELLNEELRKVPQGSKAFKELRQELVKTNKEIKNTELAMESLDNEQVASELGSVAGAVGDVTAAFILLGGDEDSALGETAKRIETALGVTMAFKGGIEGIISFQKLWNNVLKQTAVVQAVYNVGQKAMAFVTSATTQATKLLRIAMLSLPFVAIGTAVALLVANFKEIMKSMGFFNKEAELMKQTMDAFKSGTADATKKVMEMESVFKLAEKGVIDKKEALDKYNKEFGKTLGAAKDLNEAERIFREKSGAYIQSVALRKQADALLTIAAEKQAEALTAHMEDNLTTADKVGSSLKAVQGGVIGFFLSADDVAEDMGKKQKQRTEERKQEADEIASVTTNLADELIKQAIDVENEFQIVSEESTDFHEKQANKRKEILARRRKAEHDLLIAMLQSRAEDEKDEKTKAVALIAIEQQKFAEMLRLDKAKKKQDRMTAEENALAVFEYQQRIDKIKEDFAQKEIERQRKVQQTINNETNELLKSVEQLENEFFNKKTEDQKRNQEIELNAIYDKYNAQIEGLKELGQSTKILEEAQEAELEDIRDKYRKIQIEKDLEVQNAKTQMALDGLKAVMDLTTAFAKDNEKSQRRAFEINKKLQIAQALIQTYQGVNAIFAARAASPESILFPAAPFIAAGIALASGLANVQNIRKQQFQGGSAGGGVNTPNFNTAGAGATAPTLSPITNTSTLVPQEPQQVFVTETDITNVQNQVAVIETQATIK